MYSHTSIFDEIESEDFKLWAKQDPNFKITSKMAERELEAYKQEKGSGTFVLRHYVLSKRKLAYKREPGISPISAIMDLNFTTANIVEVEDEEMKKHFSHFIMIIKNGKFTRIYVEDEEDARAWRAKLSRRCIMMDFTLKYEVLEVIGEGGVGKVNLIE